MKKRIFWEAKDLNLAINMKVLLLIVSVLSLTGCATAPHVAPITMVKPVGGIYHRIESGQTLWSISRLYDVDLKALVNANPLQDASMIKTGQLLFIPGVYKKKDMLVKDSFIWPAKGSVISYFGTKVDYAKNKGIDIRAKEGADIKASRPGKVVFCDEYLKGFGKTVILDHGDGYQSVYAYNSDILVKVGDSVKQDETIGRVGRTGRAKEASLHFEIRKDGEAQNPFYYLSH